MSNPTSEQGFIGVIYKGKTHEDLHTYLPKGKRPISTKWIFKNKKEERGIVIRNKARLVSQGYTQEEGINYDDVFAPVARIEAVRLFLAYTSFTYGIHGLFIIGCESAFFMVRIEEEVYVDDIIFGSANKELCTGFEKLIKENQDKYVDEILKKFNYNDAKSASTPVDLEKPLVKDRDATDVDVHLYRSMIESLMYLTASRPDIMFAVCACARFQVTPKTSHLTAVKRDFKYLKGKPTLGLWYSRDSPFELLAYTDSDYAGATRDRKSTTGGCQFLDIRISKEVGDEAIHKEWGDRMKRTATTASSFERGADAQPEFSDKHNMVVYLEKSKGSEGSHKIIDFLNASHIKYALIKNSIIYVSFIKQFWRTAIANTRTDGEDQQHSTSPLRITSSPSLSSQTYQPSPLPQPMDTTHKTEEPTPMPHDSPLHSVHSLERDEGSMKHTKLMELVTKLTDRIEVLEKDLQQTKKTYSTAFTKLIFRVKKLEKQIKPGKARKKARIDEGTLWFQEDGEVHEKTSADTKVLLEEEILTKLVEDGGKGEKEVSTANIPVSTASTAVSTASTNVSTAAATLVYIRRSAEKKKDKGKAIMIESEPLKKIKKRDQTKPVFVPQERKNMITYLKNLGGYKLSDFKKMSYDDIRPIFEKEETLARKRAGEKKSADNVKRPKLQEVEEYEKEKEELRLRRMEVKDMAVYKVTRADGSASYHGYIQAFLRRLDRQDLEAFYKLAQEEFQDHPLKGHDLMLWGD
ncbi:putative ribonuclease H-like domain-containing protein [Tanacetum coccineum]